MTNCDVFVLEYYSLANRSIGPKIDFSFLGILYNCGTMRIVRIYRSVYTMQRFITFYNTLFRHTVASRKRELIIRLVKVEVSYNYATNSGRTNNNSIYLYCSRFVLASSSLTFVPSLGE